MTSESSPREFPFCRSKQFSIQLVPPEKSNEKKAQYKATAFPSAFRDGPFSVKAGPES